MVFNPDYVTKEAREAGINTKEGKTAKTITAPVSLWSLMELIRSKKGFNDLVMEIACALHNFRLKFRPWRNVEVGII